MPVHIYACMLGIAWPAAAGRYHCKLLQGWRNSYASCRILQAKFLHLIGFTSSFFEAQHAHTCDLRRASMRSAASTILAVSVAVAKSLNCDFLQATWRHILHSLQWNCDWNGHITTIMENTICSMNLGITPTLLMYLYHADQILLYYSDWENSFRLIFMIRCSLCNFCLLSVC